LVEDRSIREAAMSGDRQEPAGLRLEILGPLRGFRGGTPLRLGPVQQQVVLAVLALHANRPISRSQLILAVWGAQAPAYAVNLVQKHISTLRRVLQPDRLEREASQLTWTRVGYQLSLPPGALDLQVFEAEVDRARAAGGRGDLAETGNALRAALALWRGPLCAGLAGPLVEAERDRLAERRVAMLEERLEIDLAQGHHDDVVAESRQLITDFPLRERLYELLMVALYRCGRQADALATFQQARRRLHDDLGIEPAPPLQRLHTRILTADPSLDLAEERRPFPAPAAPVAVTPASRPSDPVPAQLPHGLAHFAGRRGLLDQLHLLLDEAHDRPVETPVIIAIDGTAGVGKTALAVQWARQVSDRFPDGQLYVNLRGFDPGGAAVAPGEAIRAFLDAVGVPPQRLPTSLSAKAAVYRSLLAGKRMLVVLDNARDADQVRPLLPGAPGCLTVVTSRNRLTSLVVTEGAYPLTVDLLSRSEARDLLTARIGVERVLADPIATTELITMCAGLPLALAIVAARAALNPHFALAVLAAQLRRTQGLDAFDSDDEAIDVRAVFSWSYRSVSEPVARLFRLLGLHPGPHVTIAAAASLAGTGRRDTGRALAELTRAHLIEELAPGWYALHDLLRAYAGELAEEGMSADERRAAVRRMLDYTLHTVHAADRLLDPHVPPLDLEPTPAGVTTEDLDDCEEALAWFTAEHQFLLSAVNLARAAGLQSHGWQLPRTMATYLHRQGHWDDQVAVQREALDAGRLSAGPVNQGHSHCMLARACSMLGRHDDAHAHLRAAIDLYGTTGDRNGLAHAYLVQARVLYKEGSHRAALGDAQQALALFRATRHRAGQAAALNAVGWFHALLGDHGSALARCREALDLHQQLGDPYGAAAAWDSVGYARHHLGDHAEAVSCYRHAIELWRQLGDRFQEADTLRRLADAHRTAGDDQAARRAWKDAWAILDALHHPDAAELRAKLDTEAVAVCV
jgi:DNA-binding SARP family transcriptional activator